MPPPSGSTPILGLPYPVPNDAVDVPRDIKALADKLDPYQLYLITGTWASLPSVGSVPEGARYHASDKGVTYQKISGSWARIHAYPLASQTLPVSPVEGQQWMYKPGSPSAAARWYFEYDATAAVWVPIGDQQPMASQDPSQTNLAANTAWQLVPGPAVAVAFAGTYHIRLSGTVYPGGGSGHSMNVGWGSAGGVVSQVAVANSNDVSGNGFPFSNWGFGDLTVGYALRMWAAMSYPNGAISSKSMECKPIQITG